MTDGILSPEFLQAACAKKQEEPEQPVVINLKALQADPTITAVTSAGVITITTTKNGQPSTQTSGQIDTYPLQIEADDQAAITLSAVGLVIDTLGNEVELVTE